jgi:hypothetical protein
VAALVDKLIADSMSLTLVNVNQLEPRIVTVQAGAYGEHSVHRRPVQQQPSRLTILSSTFVRLRARLVFDMFRYAHQPTGRTLTRN